MYIIFEYRGFYVIYLKDVNLCVIFRDYVSICDVIDWGFILMRPLWDHTIVIT